MSRYPELDEHIELLKQDENYMKYFRQFALENINSNPKYVKEVFEHLLELVKEWNYKSAEHWCLVYIGWSENFTNDFLNASTTHLIANQFFEKEQDVEGIITTCNALLSDYLNLGEIELAIRNGIRGIELANEAKDEHNLIALLLNTAETYIESENYDEALALVERLRSYNYNIKVTDEVIILGILSKTSLNDNKLKEAYEYCNKALEIMEKNHDIKCQKAYRYPAVLFGLVFQPDERGICLRQESNEQPSDQQNRPFAGAGGAHRILDKDSGAHAEAST